MASNCRKRPAVILLLGLMRGPQTVRKPGVTDSAGSNNRHVVWRVVAGASALALTVSVVVGILLLRSHEAAEGGFDRLIPAGGVTSIVYGGSYLPLSSGSSDRRVALVSTPDDAVTVSDTDWTWIAFDPVKQLRGDGPDVRHAQSADGLTRLSIPADESGAITIISSRFGAAELDAALDEFTAVGPDVDAVAAIIMTWSDNTDLIWSGQPAEVGTTVQAGTDPHHLSTDSQMIGWIDSSDIRRFTASFRPYIDEDSVARASAFQLPVVVGLTQDFLSIPGAPAPVNVSESEWFAIVTELAGDRPPVHLSGGFLVPSPSGDITDMDRGATAEVIETDHDYTVALRFTQPVAARDPINLFAVIGESITLRFDLLYGGTPTSVVTVPARMSKREAQLWTDLINSRNS